MTIFVQKMERLSFNELAALWSTDKVSYVKESTMSLYGIILRAHLLPFFGEKDSISFELVKEYIGKKLSLGLGVKTVRDSVSLLRSIVRFGAKKGIFPYEEWDIRFPTEAKRPLDVLSLEECRKLSKVCREEFSFKNVGILIALTTGLRIGEVCALQWRDVDLSRKVVTVSKTAERIYSGDRTVVVVGPPKTASSFREVPLVSMVASFLRPFCRVMDSESYIVSGSRNVCEPRLLRKHFYCFLERSGIRRIDFHALRHTFATRLISSGCDVKTVSVLLGHASVKTTLDLYVHPDLERKRKAVEQLGKVLK